ncbi:MAG: hypothetical protein RJA70_1419 [Pseudomonadota bacterium]
MIGTIFLGLFLCGLGVYCALAPVEKYAEFYGIAGDGSAIRGWMLAKGLRDFTLGTMTFVLLAADPGALKYFVPLIPMITIGDAVITSRFSKAGAKSAIPHLGGTFVISLLAVWVLYTPL